MKTDICFKTDTLNPILYVVPAICCIVIYMEIDNFYKMIAMGGLWFGGMIYGVVNNNPK